MRHSLFANINKDEFKKNLSGLSKQKSLFVKECSSNLYDMQGLCDMTVVINEKNIDKVVTLLVRTKVIIIADKIFFEMCNGYCEVLRSYGIDICCCDVSFNEYKEYKGGTIIILRESMTKAKEKQILSNAKSNGANSVVIRSFTSDKRSDLLELFFLSGKDMNINLCIDALFNCIIMGVVAHKIRDFGEMINC